jgi:hypothetical protein
MEREERERERERVCRTTIGVRGRGGEDPAMEEERAKEECGPDGGSRVWRLRPGGRHGSRAL